MNKILFSIVVLFFFVSANAQPTPDCSTGRYTNNVFTNVTKTSGVTYGYNSTKDYSTNTQIDYVLKFDFYEPAGDAAAKRPLVILMFGGGFIAGQRSDLDAFCMALAKKGYTAATIDYRLVSSSFFNLLTVFSSAPLINDAVVKASGDLKAAIRYFKKDAATSNLYKIDTTKIIVGGASAGSIAALQAAYTDDVSEDPTLVSTYQANGGFEGNTDLQAPNNLLPTYNARGIAAVINIAGGVSDTSLIDAFNPPIYSSAGTMDEVIPYNYGPISYNGFTTPVSIYGSNLITTRANNIGLRNELLPVPGGNHESPGGVPYINQIIENSSAFIAPIACRNVLPVTLAGFTVQASNCSALLRWKTAVEQHSSHYDVEVSTDGTRFSKLATVPSKNLSNGFDYSYNLTGYNQPALFRLKISDKDGSYTYSPVQRFTPSCLPAVQVYPNPANQFVKITGLTAGMQVRVRSVDGKALYLQKSPGTSMTIPVNRFANGLLLIQVIGTNGEIVSTNKVLKQ